MASQQTHPSAAGAAAAQTRSAMAVTLALLSLAVLGLIAWHARMGAVSPRIANPEVTGVPRPVEFLFGWPHWLVLHQVGTVVHDGRARRRVLLGLATAPCPPLSPDGARVDGDRLAGPDHELGAVCGLQPAALALARRLAAGEPVAHRRALHRDRILDLLLHRPLRRVQLDLAASPGARVRRLVRLAPPARQPGAAALRRRVRLDAFLEIFLVRTGLYIYSQVIPWGSLFAGTTFQFPLIWESALVTTVMIPAGILCYRDDTGRTQAEKLARRFRWLPHRPALGTFMMMFAILNVAYFVVRRRIRSNPRFGPRDGGGLPLSVSRSQGLRPAGLLRARGCARPLFRGPLEHLDDRAAERTSDRESGKGRWNLQARPRVSRGASSSPGRRADSAWRPPPISMGPDGAWSEPCARPTWAFSACAQRLVRAPRIRACSASDSTSTTPRRSPPAAKAIEEAVGAPDVLVHNAGIAAVGSVEDMPDRVFQQVFSTNLFGPVALTRALLPCHADGGTRPDRRRIEPGG